MTRSAESLCSLGWLLSLAYLTIRCRAKFPSLACFWCFQVFSLLLLVRSYLWGSLARWDGVGIYGLQDSEILFGCIDILRILLRECLVFVNTDSSEWINKWASQGFFSTVCWNTANVYAAWNEHWRNFNPHTTCKKWSALPRHHKKMGKTKEKRKKEIRHQNSRKHISSTVLPDARKKKEKGINKKKTPIYSLSSSMKSSAEPSLSSLSTSMA